ncbi:hypothetical protein DPMN_168528 [Dreissena polymorpha]|uniref:Receptor ligand binding region domain-containing protein n=1 Tax=Dreissena polymorpha TaxID=45954 RepID=A0A9D4F0U2_DREPO|nr:hypothetical protein DPMN_168528 [Dreissena polymorpha]
MNMCLPPKAPAVHRSTNCCAMFFNSFVPLTTENLFLKNTTSGLTTRFLKDTGWKNFIIVRDKNKEYDALAEILESTLSSFNAIGFRFKQVHKLHKAMEYDDDNKYTDIDATLNSEKHEGRIVLLVIDQFNLRNVMLQAHKLKMTNGDYQFLYTYGRNDTRPEADNEMPNMTADKSSGQDNVPSGLVTDGGEATAAVTRHDYGSLEAEEKLDARRESTPPGSLCHRFSFTHNGHSGPDDDDDDDNDNAVDDDDDYDDSDDPGAHKDRHAQAIESG